MQPTYLPWAGYFNLMIKSDVFIILDDVQFEKQSWQNRNRILQNGKEVILSIPLQSMPKTTKIMNIKVHNNKWKKKHYQSIIQSYAKSKYKGELIMLIEPVYDLKSDYLIDYTIFFIERILHYLELNVKVVRSSNMKMGSTRSQRLIDICLQAGITDYLSPEGSRNYLEEDGLIPNDLLNLEYQTFIAREYPQINSLDFTSHLSVIDIIANMGIKGLKKYIIG